MHPLTMRGSLHYPPVARPRPYADITEVDPHRVPFDKTMGWALYRGFYDQHHEYYGSAMEPDE